MIWIAVLVLLLLALLGAPLFAVLLGAAALGFYTQGSPLAVLHIDIYQLSDSVVLMALPLFTFAGFLLSESRTADRLVRLSQAAFGWMPGGMAFVALIACAFFTALTGGSGVTIVALGALLLPALVKAGYPRRFSLGLVTSSGSLGLLLVPSVPLLIYGIIAQQLSQQLAMPAVEIVDLYLAGIGPALLMVVLLGSLALARTVGLLAYGFSAYNVGALVYESLAALAAFVAIFALAVPFPLVVVAAGALGLALAGPRRYDGREVADPWLGDGRHDAHGGDIHRALNVILAAWAVLAASVAAAALI